ncbi:MAG: tetratricopeptide repeat protein [Ruminococcus sp.]|nr:tetratricopeptide repeat protein [Ruminococcus sp.]
MKKLTCKQCNEHWYVDDESVTKQKRCPYCEAELRKKGQMSLDTFAKTLYYITEKYGVDILYNSAKLLGYLMDIAPNYKKEIKIFKKSITVENTYLLQKLFNDNYSDKKDIIVKLRYLLIEEEGLSEQWADMICDSVYQVYIYREKGLPEVLYVSIIDFNHNKSDNTDVSIAQSKPVEKPVKIQNKNYVTTQRKNTNSSKGKFFLKNGISLYNSKNYTQAYKALTEAAKEGETQAYVLIGNIELERHNYKKAIEWLLKAANEGDGEAAYKIGLYYENAGQTQEAKKHYKVSLNLGYAPAKAKLDRFF